jgi:hypothetical protein
MDDEPAVVVGPGRLALVEDEDAVAGPRLQASHDATQEPRSAAVLEAADVRESDDAPERDAVAGEGVEVAGRGTQPAQLRRQNLGAGGHGVPGLDAREVQRVEAPLCDEDADDRGDDEAGVKAAVCEREGRVIA